MLTVVTALTGCASGPSEELIQSELVTVRGVVGAFEPDGMVLHRVDVGGVLASGTIDSAELSTVVVTEPVKYAGRKVTIRLAGTPAEADEALRTLGASVEFELPAARMKADTDAVVDSAELKWPNQALDPTRVSRPAIGKAPED